ncbi:MAG: glycosyltransferase family 4 protein, partial [Saprospiraceae bacterium]|nr:glycosyltransferase family 4 protein [Saprospiraceae bacterium]
MASRILFIGNFLSRSRGTTGPTERVAPRLKAYGHEFWLVSRVENRWLRFLHILTACLFYPYDQIQVDTYSGRSFLWARWATRLAAWRKKKVALHLHGGGLPEYYEQNPQMVERCLRRAGRLYAPSMRIVDFFASKGWEVVYLPNFIDNDLFQFREKAEQQHRILWVRAFAPVYQPELAIRTFALLKQKYPDARLCMAGPDLGLRTGCERLAAQLHLSDSIEFAGPVPNETLPTYYYTHDVFLNTTRLESFGLALLEAASSGTPMVSTGVGEIPFLWRHLEAALLSPENDPQTLAALITQLFEEPELAQRLRKV